MKFKNAKRHEVQPIDLLKQELLIPVTPEEFFPVGSCGKVIVNMTSCFKLDDEEDKGRINRRTLQK